MITFENYATDKLCPKGNESVPKIIMNDTIIFLNRISILVVSNHDSFRVLFDKIASVYFT